MTMRTMALVLCGVVAGAAAAGVWNAKHANGVDPSVSDMKLPPGEFPFLSDYSVPFKQTKGNWLPDVSQDQLEKNKELVIRYNNGDLSVLADGYVEHDPGEPSTRIGWTTFIHNKHPGASLLHHPKQPGFIPSDATGRGLDSMIAEGDIVVVVAKINYKWPGGPTPLYQSIMVNVWRVQDGKLAEHWVTTRAGDDPLALIQRAKEKGYWYK